MRAMGGGRGDPRRHGARLVDAFLQDLALAVFAVDAELVRILRRVQLPHVRVDAYLPEHAVHAERARFVRHDRHHARADLRVFQQLRQHAHERHRGGKLAPVTALQACSALPGAGLM
ncbi:hypothetical protein G6F31_018293 [Rhizopus arrhizus]|nr:hypothetical protein G6F31_018293 [Rhizopus arrhizus]